MVDETVQELQPRQLQQLQHQRQRPLHLRPQPQLPLLPQPQLPLLPLLWHHRCLNPFLFKHENDNRTCCGILFGNYIHG